MMLGSMLASVAVAAVALFGASTPDEAPVAPHIVSAPIDFLTLDYGSVSDLVWDAIGESDAVMSDPNDGAERFYLPVGVQVDVPGGWVRATPDGWMACEDWTTTGAECSGTEWGEPMALAIGS